jgi:hypothetical protein
MSCSIRVWTLRRFERFLYTPPGRDEESRAKSWKRASRQDTPPDFRRFEMTATLTGLRLYMARGYAEAERSLIPSPNGVSYPVVKLSKTITSL